MNIQLSSNNKMLKLFVTLKIIVAILGQAELDVTMTVSSVNSLSNYTFNLIKSINDPGDIAQNSTIQIKFPAQYSLVSGNYTCSILQWSIQQSISSLNCTILGLILTINNGFPNNYLDVSSSYSDYFQFMIQNITNPSWSQQTDIFVANIISPAGAIQLNFSTLNSYGVTITTGALSCSLTASPTTINTLSTLIVSLTPSNPILTDGIIQIITSSQFWPQDTLKLANSTIFYTSTSYSCQNITNVNSNIICKVAIQPGTNNFIVTITNAVNSNITQPISFGLLHIVTPPSTLSQGSFTIITQTSSSGYIDQCTGVKISGITPGLIKSASFEMKNTLINSASTGTFNFSISDYVATSDLILITFPSQLTFSISNITHSSSIQINTYSISGQVLSFSIGKLILPSNPKIQIQITAINNPTSILPTDSFNISTSRSNAIIDTLSSSLIYTATAGTLTATLTANILEMGANSNYTFNIVTQNLVTNTSILYITFPTSFNLTANTYACVSTKSATVICSYSNYVISAINFTSSSLPAGSSILLTIYNIPNPLLIGNFSSITISTTYRDTNDIVDIISNGLSLNLTARILPSSNVNLLSTSYLTYTTSTLTFNITNQNPLPYNSMIYIFIPPQLIFSTQNCKINNFGIACSNETFNNVPCLKITLSYVIDVGQLNTYLISIINVITPISTQPTDSFQIYLVYSNNVTSEYLNSGLYFSANTGCSFQALSITPNNSQNYALTTYSFIITPSFILQNNTVASIVFPQLMNPTNQCQIASSALSSITCSKNTNTVLAVLSFTSSSSIPVIEFTISSIKNYPVQQYQYDISVTLYTSNTLSYIYSTGTYYNTNNLPNLISINSYSFSNPYLYSNSTLTINFTPTTPILTTGYIAVTFPNEFILNIDCNSITNFNCSVNNNVVNLTSNSNITAARSVVFNNLLTPTYTPSNNITIASYLNVNGMFYIMDLSTVVRFTTLCNLYCLNCNSGNASFCISCYSNSSLVAGHIYLNYDNTCITNCTATYYLSSLQCLACSKTCANCINYDTCTSCPSNYYLLNGTCLLDCPSSYFIDYINLRCSLCNSTGMSCQTCSNNITCLTCISTYFLYGTMCLSACPNSTTYFNTTSEVCLNCNSSITNCAKCLGFPPVCTSCSNPYLLDSGLGVCFSSCQSEYKVSNGTNCVGCNSPCLNCSGNANNCTVCNISSDNKYLFQNYCLSNCPSTYFNDDASNYTCTKCTPPCGTCANASNNTCNSCINGYYFLTSESYCTAVCPDGTYPNNNNCSICNSSCFTCTSQNVCTSCIPSLYYLYNVCYTSCPSNMISNGNVCLNCSTNCYTCINVNSSQCISCYSGFFLLSGVCYVSCPAPFYNGNITNCSSCNSSCSACISVTVCTACISGLVLSNNTCINSCPGNQIPINYTCQSCVIGCLTCINTTAICLSCQTNYLYNVILNTCSATCANNYYNYLNTSCVSTCPDGYYNSTSVCQLCNTICVTCTSLAFCSSCNSTMFLYNGMCYTSCPTTAPYQIGNVCVTCNISNCETCSGTSCIACYKNLLLISYNACITSCSSNETYNYSILKCELNPNSIITSLSINFVPLPYMIICVLFAGTILLSKLHHDKVNFINALLPIISFANACAALTNLGVFLSTKISSGLTVGWIILIFGLIFLFGMNLINQIFIYIHLRSDEIYLKHYTKNMIGVIVVFIISVLTSFKFIELLYSFYFSFGLFSLTLSKNDYPKKYEILQWISLLPIFALIISGGFAVLQESKSSYLFFGGIQNIILGAAQIGFTLTSLRSPKEYIKKYNETETYGVNAAAQMDEVESHTQLDGSDHHININNKSQQQNESDPKQLSYPANIMDFDEKGNINLNRPDTSDFQIRRAESTELIPEKLVITDQYEYKSAYDYNRDVMVIRKQKIADAINQGVFRHTLKSIIQHQKKEDQQSALDDAVKLNAFQLRRKDMNNNTPIIEAKEEEQKNSEHEEQINNAELKHNQQIIFEEQLVSAPTHISQSIAQEPKRVTTLGSLEPIKQQQDYRGTPVLQKQENNEKKNQSQQQKPPRSKLEQKFEKKSNSKLSPQKLFNRSPDKNSPSQQMRPPSPSILNSSRSRTVQALLKQQQKIKSDQNLNLIQNQLKLKLELPKRLSPINQLKNDKSNNNTLIIEEIDFDKKSEKPVKTEKKSSNAPIEESKLPGIVVKDVDLQSIFTVQDRQEDVFEKKSADNNRYYAKLSKYKKQDKRYLQQDQFQDLKKPSQLFNKGRFKKPQVSSIKSYESKSSQSKQMFNRVGKMLLNSSFNKNEP